MTTQQVEDVIRTCHHADLVVDWSTRPDERPQLLSDGAQAPPVDEGVEDELIATLEIDELLNTTE